MSKKEREKIQIKIHGTGSHGEGVGSLDGYTIFIPGALPGETVEAVLVEKQKRYGRGSLLSVIDASIDRVKPPCPLFGTCGGCQVMHLVYHKQLEMKRQKVIDALERIGQIKDVEVASCIPSPDSLGYRNKVQLLVRQGKAGIETGFFAASSHNLVEVPKCYIHSSLGDKVYQKIRDLLRKSIIKGYDPKKDCGELRHILIKSAFSSEEVLVVFVTTGKPSEQLKRLSKTLFDQCSEVKGVVHNQNAGRGKRTFGKQFKVLEGAGSIDEELCGLTFRISPNSFFQVNPKQAEQLYRKAIEYADCKGEETLVDAYCGVGTLALTFANRVKKVIGIECISQAVEDARDNAKRNSISNVNFVHGKAEEEMSHIDQMDILLLNPPRQGCDKKLMGAIEKKKPSKVLYISCDPATLARDLKMLQVMGYRVDRVQPFDMFPQTAHVETLVLLSI